MLIVHFAFQFNTIHNKPVQNYYGICDLLQYSSVFICDSLPPGTPSRWMVMAERSPLVPVPALLSFSHISLLLFHPVHPSDWCSFTTTLSFTPIHPHYKFSLLPSMFFIQCPGILLLSSPFTLSPISGH